MSGSIHQINMSGGGVPKKAAASGRVTSLGLEGDAQAKTAIHGGPYRAISLFPLEHIEALAAEGHPISPGSVGENLTTSGLDWSELAPGAVLAIGSGVRLRITSYAAPCRTIAGSFRDGNMNRLSQQREPGMSRLYAEVLAEGEIHPGDSIRVEAAVARDESAIPNAQAVRAIPQVSIPVSDLEHSVAFYREVVGAEFSYEVPPGLAFLRVGETTLMLDGPEHGDGPRASAATIYFTVDDIDASYEAMRARGAVFDAAPIRQFEMNGVEGWMAFFADPDGNPLALVEVRQVGG